MWADLARGSKDMGKMFGRVESMLAAMAPVDLGAVVIVEAQIRASRAP